MRRAPAAVGDEPCRASPGERAGRQSTRRPRHDAAVSSAPCGARRPISISDALARCHYFFVGRHDDDDTPAHDDLLVAAMDVSYAKHSTTIDTIASAPASYLISDTRDEISRGRSFRRSCAPRRWAAYHAMQSLMYQPRVRGFTTASIEGEIIFYAGHADNADRRHIFEYRPFFDAYATMPAHYAQARRRVTASRAPCHHALMSRKKAAYDAGAVSFQRCRRPA